MGPSFQILEFKFEKFKIGGAGRSRTDDPLLAKQMLFQLSYGPYKEPGCVVDPHETGKEQMFLKNYSVRLTETTTALVGGIA
tara:strand:- start:31903 stop:32148 length:246 start_codon:yes stop_codon:yes gene_type:complete